MPVLWLVFALEYSQNARWLEIRPIYKGVFLWIVPATTLLLAMTNERHGLIWSSIRPSSDAPGASLVYGHGLWFWVHVVYSYGMLLGGIGVLIGAMLRFPQVYRRQALAIVIGATIPLVGNLVYVTGHSPLRADLTPLAFSLTGIIYATGVFRFQVFNFFPVAFDSLVEGITDGIVIFDEQEHVIALNQTAREILAVEDAVGKSAEAVVAAWPELLAHCCRPTQGPRVFCLTRNPLRYIDLRVSCLHDHRQRAAGWLAVLRDVTEQRLADERLRLQSVALASAATAVMIAQTDGTIIWVNPAFTTITGYTVEETIGQTPRLLKSGVHDANFYHSLWSTILAGDVWQGECVNRHKDGSTYIEEQIIAPVRDEHDQVTHFIAVKQDITARRQLEKMRDDLVHTVIHDLRSPLTSIQASLELLPKFFEEAGLPTVASETMQIGKDNAQRMQVLINAILDLNRLESKSMPLERQLVTLPNLVEDACRLQAPLANRRGIMVLNGVDFKLPSVLADPQLIERVLQNLIDNALKFTPDGGYVEVCAQEDATRDDVLISIRDNGPGIPAELHERLFQKFATSDTRRRGAGLGLAFCRLAVEAHGGRIWVESTSEQGTAFCFTLPVAPA